MTIAYYSSLKTDFSNGKYTRAQNPILHFSKLSGNIFKNIPSRSHLRKVLDSNYGMSI